MKKRKLLILLVAILSLTLLLVSCTGSEEATESSAESATIDPSLIQNGAAQQAKDHEIRNYFNLENKAEEAVYSEIQRIDGEIVEKDTEHNLIAVKTVDLDVWNQEIETVKVYDLTTGTVINTQTQANGHTTAANERIELRVEIDYPIIRVVREDKYDSTFNISYYPAKAGAEGALHTTALNDHALVSLENGFVACKAGDKILWIDKDMDIVRTVDAVIANGYNVNADEFKAEYMGYVYAWDEYSLQIFNRSGMCCAEYNAEKGSSISVFILNNGNALIQKQTIVDEYTPCDFINRGERTVLTNYIMTFTDGTMTEIDLDFLVQDINTSYEEENDLPFALAEGRENQAIIQRFAEEKLSVVDEYVVFDNSVKIEYTLKNTTVGVQIDEAEALNVNYYTAPVLAGGVTQKYIFDLDGNKIARHDDENVNTKFIVTDSAIYDYHMNLVYDIAANGYEFVEVDKASANVFLKKLNFTTGANEYYLFNGTSAEPTLFTNEIDASYIEIKDGIFTTKENETALKTICDANGKTYLIAYNKGRNCTITEYDGVLLIETKFESKTINYILK